MGLKGEKMKKQFLFIYLFKQLQPDADRNNVKRHDVTEGENTRQEGQPTFAEEILNLQNSKQGETKGTRGYEISVGGWKTYKMFFVNQKKILYLDCR